MTQLVTIRTIASTLRLFSLPLEVATKERLVGHSREVPLIALPAAISRLAAKPRPRVLQTRGVVATACSHLDRPGSPRKTVQEGKQRVTMAPIDRG